MIVRFNRFEKIAGLFVAVSFAGFMLAGAGILVKNGLLAKKVQFQ